MNMERIEDQNGTVFSIVNDSSAQTKHYIISDLEGNISEVFSYNDLSADVFIPFDSQLIEDFLKGFLNEQEEIKFEQNVMKKVMYIKEFHEVANEVYEELTYFINDEAAKQSSISKEDLNLFKDELYMKYQSKNKLEYNVFKVIYEKETLRILEERK